MGYKIKHVLFCSLRNEEHFGFHSEFSKLVNEYDLSEAFTALIAIYNDRYGDLDAAVEITRTSSITRQLVTADNLRVATYRRLRSAVRGHLHHAEPDKIESAWRIYDIIRQYGNLARSSRDKRTYGLANMLQDWRERTSADLQLLGLSIWAGELEAKNEAYKTLKVSRYAEREARPVKTVRECRLALDAAYHSVIRQIKVHGDLKPEEPDFVALATGLNERVEAYNRLSAQRKGIMATRKENPDQVAESSPGVSAGILPRNDHEETGT